jgi:ABC-2 type transport system ATP-binding protein
MPHTPSITPTTDAPCLAQLSHVRKSFGAVVALDDLTLPVYAGELVAVLGPNGAGKSTAISLLLGLQRPDIGTALLFGRPPQSLDTRRRIGVMMQEVVLAPDLRVREHLALVASYYPSPMPLDEVMELTHIAPLATRSYGKLSGGQKRLVQFAIAICGRPDLLFLDEPTVGLDVEARTLLWTTLRELLRRGVSIVLTTHYLEEAEALADRVAVIARGRLIASGTVNDIRSVVDRKRIVCSTRLLPREIERWPDVLTVTNDQHRLQLTVRNAEAVVRRLLAADDSVQDLEVIRAKLADAFNEITQEAAQ